MECEHRFIKAETLYNQAWLSGVCEECGARMMRAYCAGPGYGMPEEAEELPDEAFEWEAVGAEEKKMRAKEVSHMGSIVVEGRFVGILAPEYPKFCAHRMNFGGVELRSMVGGPEGFRILGTGKNRRSALRDLHRKAKMTQAAIGE